MVAFINLDPPPQRASVEELTRWTYLQLQRLKDQHEETEAAARALKIEIELLRGRIATLESGSG